MFVIMPKIPCILFSCFAIYEIFRLWSFCFFSNRKILTKSSNYQSNVKNVPLSNRFYLSLIEKLALYMELVLFTPESKINNFILNKKRWLTEGLIKKIVFQLVVEVIL